MHTEPLTTDRLLIRPLEPGDASEIHRILDLAFGDGSQIDDPAALAERREWVEWSRLGQIWAARLHQPPYGERAVALRESGALIGAVGLVPAFGPFGQLPGVAGAPGGLFAPEVGLFWAIDPGHQRRGYAAEAGAALISYAFAALNLWRIVATTEYDNAASQRVMAKLGMELLRNPLPNPPWFQVAGVLYNPQVNPPASGKSPS